MIRCGDKKRTPKQFAAKILASNVELADYWHESHEEEYSRMTEKECQAIEKQILKLQKRILSMLEKAGLYV